MNNKINSLLGVIFAAVITLAVAAVFIAAVVKLILWIL